MITKAMIMAAGVGSRLEPLTLTVPKPLVKIANVPVMDILLCNLKKYGISGVIANTYYLAEQIIERYSNKKTIDIDFSYIKEENLSGTAGGLKQCQHFFEEDESFLVVSADGLFDIDLKKVFESHKKSGAIATIVAKNIDKKEVSKFGVIVCDDENYVKEFQEKPALEDAKSTLINTGIYVFDYRIFDYIPENQFFDFAKNVFPALMGDNEKINVYQTDEYWCDMGSIEQYKQTHHDIFNGFLNFENLKFENNLICGQNSKINSSVKLSGNNVIGNNCIIEKNVVLENSIIYDNVKIGANTVIKNSIIAENSSVLGKFNDKIIEANTILEKILEVV